MFFYGAYMASFLKEVPGGVELRIKVVPGASRSQIDGLYGDFLKIRIAAPPERGKANDALVSMLAGLFELSPGQIAVVGGATSPRKTVRINGRTIAQAAKALGLARV